MNSTKAILATAAVALMLPPASPANTAPRADRPNFVVLMLDDLGFSDLGCYGGEIRTPNIDKLASDGLRFRRFYNSSRCCPSRASLLTGLYPHQVGLTQNGRDLSRDAGTVAEHLRASGYQTAMAGKWHLSATTPLGESDTSPEHYAWLNHQADRDRPFADPATYPINRGFDRAYGPIWGVVNYFDPFSLVDGVKPVRDVPADYYITDAISARAVTDIQVMSGRDQPFFLYVAHCAPHWPLHARPEDIARYKGRYDAGWHALRDERYRRQVALGLIDPKTQSLPPLMGRGPDWAALTAEQRRFEASLMEVHAAMVDRVDQGVGAIVQALKDANRFDNTVFIVLADNGASPERYLASGFDRSSATRAGQPIQYRGTFEPGPATTWGYIGAYWANALNTPYRYWKVESFEGGCHTPMIVHWPIGLKTAPGSLTDQAGHVIDLTPTCLDLAGATPLPTLDGHPSRAIEGKSLAPILAGQTREGHRALYFEHEGGRAVLADDGWKLVAARGKPWELYHVATDATETRDVAPQHPDRVAALSAQWLGWAERVGANIPTELKRTSSRPLPPAGASIELTPGQVLAGPEAPVVAATPFRVEAVVRDATKGGVVVSQGAQVQGWSLFVRDGKPVFAVRRTGKLREISSEQGISDGPVRLAAELDAGGKIRLWVDEVEVASGDAGGLIPAQPADPLIVGDDRLGAVASYPTSAPFRGTVLRARISRPSGSNPPGR